MGPSRDAELPMVSMTTAESSGAGHFSLLLRKAGWLALLLPGNSNISVNLVSPSP